MFGKNVSPRSLRNTFRWYHICRSFVIVFLALYSKLTTASGCIYLRKLFFGTTNNKLTWIKTLAYSMGCEREPTTARTTNPLHVDSSSVLDIFSDYGEKSKHTKESKHRHKLRVAITGTRTQPLSSMARGYLCTWIRGATSTHDLISLVKSSVVRTLSLTCRQVFNCHLLIIGIQACQR